MQRLKILTKNFHQIKVHIQIFNLETSVTCNKTHKKKNGSKKRNSNFNFRAYCTTYTNPVSCMSVGYLC